jgi:hypothetical protein
MERAGLWGLDVELELWGCEIEGHLLHLRLLCVRLCGR